MSIVEGIRRSLPLADHARGKRLAVTCQLNGGASGGGWMIEGGETLNSVTDYGYFDEASPAYGSYFGKEVARLYGRAAAVR